MEPLPSAFMEGLPSAPSRDGPTAAFGGPASAIAGVGGPEAIAGVGGPEEPQQPKGSISRNNRTLEQMMSLKPGDDERTEISKKVSWILRHGARKVGVEIDSEGWVLLADLSNCGILRGVHVQKLLDVILESNEQKARYEIKDIEQGQAIRAVAKHTIGAVAKDRRRREGPRGDPKEAFGDEGGQQGGRLQRDRVDRADRGERGDQMDNEMLPTLEQQIQDGFRPVYHGTRIVAMVREGETARPGRRSELGKGKGKGRGRGEGGDFGRPLEAKGRGRGPPRGELPRRPGPQEFLQEVIPQRPAGQAFNPFEQRLRWRAQSGQEAIMRASKFVESEQVGTIAPGSIVVQTGEEEVMQHGIIRMPVEYYNAMADVIVRGWVTRTAEAANGPIFFRPANEGKDFADRGKGQPRGLPPGDAGKGRPHPEQHEQDRIHRRY